MKIVILAVCSVIAASTPALAQTSPLASSAKQVLGLAKTNIMKSAEQVSEADYAFKPVDTVRNFGAILGHIANANFMICSMGSGAANPMKDTDIEKTKTTKADLQKALAESFAFCEAQFDAMTDAKATEMVDFFRGKQPRQNVLWFNIAHDMEHYGNLVTYMRMKGLVPPSSQGGM
jgi:uncharacterized damage-inducible protein DinB